MTNWHLYGHTSYHRMILTFLGTFTLKIPFDQFANF